MTKSLVLRTIARSCKELRVKVNAQHQRAGIFREMRKQLAANLMRQDYPEVMHDFMFCKGLIVSV
jgi:hypothetical protein